jgi:hypothetical protein
VEHRNEVRNAGNRHGHAVEIGHPRAFTKVVERHGFLDEEIDVDAGIGRAPEREHLHVLVTRPGGADLRVVELRASTGGARAIAKGREGFHGRKNVVTFQRHDQVEILRQSEMTMEHDRYSAHDDVTHTGFPERLQDQSDVPSGHVDQCIVAGLAARSWGVPFEWLAIRGPNLVRIGRRSP